MKSSIGFSKKAEYPPLFVLTILLTAFNQSCRVGVSYEKPRANVEQRVANLVSQMTLEEKVAQMSHHAPAIDRLGVIAYEPIPQNINLQENDEPPIDQGWWNEALHGVARSGLATVFPQAIALGSTWDPDLLGEVATAISDEARVYNNLYNKKLTYFSPVVNMLRDPRWGRTEEGYSEDPYLMSRMGVAFVKGMQGNHSKYLKTIATPKHFVANNSEFNRHNGSSNVSERDLREYYLPAFKACIIEGGAFSTMSAFNALNDVPCSANKTLLTDILRNEWGFKGYVVSDCGAVSDIVHQHKYITDPAKAVAAAVKAGLDLECEFCGDEDSMYDKYLMTALQQGLLKEDDIDTVVKRLFRARFLLGEFDPPKVVPYTAIPVSELNASEHQRLALKAARESIVLLKNENQTLPLNPNAVKSIAVIGPNADEQRLGGYSGTPPYCITTLEGIKRKVPDSVTVRFAQGCLLADDNESGISEAVELAENSDVAIVVVGTSLQIADEELDTTTLELPGIQRKLIRNVYQANPKTIVVLINGAPLAINRLAEHIPAIIEAWYPGQSGGTAIADCIFGDYNPGGKLPITFYKSADQLPPLEDYDITRGRTYWYFDGEPLYPFGYGLSYTTFDYNKLELSSKSFDVLNEGSIIVSVDVKNTGDYDGDEVVQLYVKDLEYTFLQPRKELRAFKRIHLKAGEKKTVTFELNREDFAFWHDRVHKWAVEIGEFELQIGSSSEDIRLSAFIEVPES
ncbi:glycoside hydrolase family 3 C-terminal domain-containing protein [Planctomycetota bacterium]